MTNEELKACPFCGGDAYYNYTDAGADRRYDRVHCKKCDARIGHPYTSKEKAREAWNTRTQPRADVEQVEDIVTEAMQDIWNDWCADTGSIPCDFERKGRKTYFQAGKWASNVARQVQCRLAAQGYLCSNDTTKVTQENSYVTEAPPEWQPIESAPKDGTHVWGWNEGDSRSNGYECWFGEDDFILGELKWLRGDGDDYSTGHYYIPCRPTHWMPLPPAPKIEMRRCCECGKITFWNIGSKFPLCKNCYFEIMKLLGATK